MIANPLNARSKPVGRRAGDARSPKSNQYRHIQLSKPAEKSRSQASPASISPGQDPPEDPLAEKGPAPGSPAGSNGPTSFGSSYARAVTLRTEVACHCPPRGALIPRAFRASAICRSDVARCAECPNDRGAMRSYRTASITASWPAISTVSPGPCVRTARASGET